MTTIKNFKTYFDTSDNQRLKPKITPEVEINTLSKTRGTLSWIFGRFIGKSAIRCQAPQGSIYISRDAFNKWKQSWTEKHLMEHKLSTIEFLNKVRIECLEKSPDDPSALFELAKAYEEGVGVEKSNQKAYEYYTQAAEKGHTEALVQKAIRLDKGLGVTKNEPEAFKAYKQAAEANHQEARFETGRRYKLAIGTEKNASNAFEMFKLAADDGHPMACFEVGQCYEKGFGVKADPSKAFEYYTNAAKLREPNAYAALARCYLDGIGCAKNAERGHHWLWKAERAGIAEADYIKAMKNGSIYGLIQAAMKGHPEALYELAQNYVMIPTYPSYYQAKLPSKQELLKRAAEAGHPKATLEFVDTLADQNERIELLGQTAKTSEDANVYYALAKEYLCKEDKDAGNEWLRLAAQKGNKDAELMLKFSK